MGSRSWVLLRGLGRSAQHWGPFLTCFRERFPGEAIELIDTAGNGSERGRPSFLKIHDYAEDLRRRSQTLQNGKINIISLSMGSMMAIDWAHHYPHEIESMTLINCSSRDRAHFYERLQLHNWQRILHSLMTKNPQQREMDILQMTAAGLRDSHQWSEQFAKIPMSNKINLMRQIWAASQFELPGNKPQVPILLLSSQEDRFVDPVCTQRIALAWGLKQQTHPDAGHDLPLCDPSWVTRKIADFVNA